MNELTVDILDAFVNSLDLSGSVQSFVDDGTNTTLTVEKTFHARAGMQLNVDGTDYEIVSVVDNTSIEVVGVFASADVYTVPNPFFFHGTPVKTNADHISGARDANKVPMVYLYEILRERDLRPNSRIVRESDLRLFFLDNADFENWTTDAHYTNRVKGLNNLVNAFIEQARNYTCCFYLYDTDFVRINHINWGVWKNNHGHERRIFDDDLTGVEVSFTLPLVNCNN